jgi:hypothetical protein
MPLFKRDKSDGDGIAAFWAWWAGRKYAVAAAIEAGTVVELVEEISSAVKAIDNGLAWELGPGHSAKHSFCVSSEGDISLRPTTQRWLISAPSPDETWEYLAARQGGKLLVLEVGPAKLNQEDFRIGIVPDEGRRRLNVALFHPGHAGLPREAQLQSAFLFLDHCLGEDDVERWVGHVELAETEPAGAVSPDGLLQAVEAMRSMAGNLTFSLLRGQDARGKPVIVSAVMSLKKIDYLFHDSHGGVVFPLGSGWPPDQNAWLRANSTLRGSAKWAPDPKWEFRRQWGG